MYIIVLNGSPKGDKSITAFTVKFLAKKFPQHNFEILNVGQKLKYYEINPEKLFKLEKADLILFSYPIYTFLAPSQLHRIIEIIKEHNINLKDKWCTQITTSKHVYDFTAHKYIEDNAHDLGMKVITGLSADMDDLLTPKGQKQATSFFENVEYCYNNNIESAASLRVHTPSQASKPVNLPEPAEYHSKNKDYDTLIITHLNDEEDNLFKMIEFFISIYPNQTRVINIADIEFKGGCLGCLKCATTAKCFYKDNFDEYLRTEIQNADATIIAFNIKDHSMGSLFKLYQDRHFCNGHRTLTMGKPLGFIVSGKLSIEDNLKTYLNAYSQVGHNQLTYIASDEFNAAKEIDNIAKQTDFALKNNYLLPQNFYGIGGHKIFRDLIYEMRGLMQADHKFYKEKGFYNDFPQNKWKRSLFMKFVGLLLKRKSKYNAKIDEAIIAPYKKLLDR